MGRLEKLAPYIIATLGVTSDLMSTQLGLAQGLREAHISYHPLYALVIFWSVLTIATLALPKRTLWRIPVYAIAYISFLGAFNNILVILGIFGGLVH
jgi:hypothetical protein